MTKAKSVRVAREALAGGTTVLREAPSGRTTSVLMQGRTLNDFEAWLEQAVRLCEREAGRRPTMQDLRWLLEAVLGASSLERWFSDGEDLALWRVRFDVKRRTNKPSVVVPPAMGDVLVIPLARGRYAFARVMSLVPQAGALLEVFREMRSTRYYDDTVADSGPLRQVLVDAVPAVEEGRWSLVSMDPHYRPPPIEGGREFAVRDADGSWIARRVLDPGHEDERPLTATEATALPLAIPRTSPDPECVMLDALLGADRS